MLPIRLELTPASIIWQQSLKRKFMEMKRKLIHVFSCSPSFIIPVSVLCYVIPSPRTRPLLMQGFPHRRSFPTPGPFLLQVLCVRASAPLLFCSLHVLPLLWEADVLVRGLPTSTDSLCSGLTQRCLLARVLF